MSDLPFSAVMIHGRPYENPFQAEIDYEMIKKCVEFIKKQNPDTIVLGNGGINAPEDAKKMVDLTGVDGVGLARGLYDKPWLFKQCWEYLEKGKYKELTIKQINAIMIKHAELVFKAKDKYGLIELRKHLLWYVSGRSNAKEMRSKLVRVETLKQLKDILSTNS